VTKKLFAKGETIAPLIESTEKVRIISFGMKRSEIKEILIFWDSRGWKGVFKASYMTYGMSIIVK